MTIIHLLVGLGGGGAEQFVWELSKQNKLENFRVIVIAITSINNIVMSEKFSDSAVQNVTLNIDRPRDFIRGFRKFLQILRQHKEVMLHTHMFHAAMLGCLAKLFVPSIHVIFTLHSNFIKRRHRRVLLYLTRSLRTADVIFSRDSKKWYHKSNPAVIPNGIKTSMFNLPLRPPVVFTCFFLGRLEEPKNPLFLIDLILKLRSKYTFRINIAGEGNLMPEMKRLVAIHKLEGWINFLGFRKDIPELLSRSHCMLMPSLWEGMPISILEAGAAGVPIIATPVGSIPSFLNSENAYVGELNSFHTLLEEVITNYDCALRKASKLKLTIVKNYDIVKCAEKHLKLYLSLENKRSIYSNVHKVGETKGQNTN